MISETFNPKRWTRVKEFQFEDITYHRTIDRKTVRIAIDRPDVRNAFRPQTVDELYYALDHARQSSHIGVVILTGNGPSKKDGGRSFCSGGDQKVRGRFGYRYTDKKQSERLHILEVQRLIRFMPKIVIAVVPGWAVGGGHSLHVICDLTIASKEYARFKQTDPDVASFDSGYGSAYLARQIGQKKAREIFFLGFEYSAQEALDMGMVNKIIPHDELEDEALLWATRINSKSPMAMKMLKLGMNMIDDGMVGQQIFAGEATRLAYDTPEAEEGKRAFLEKRKPHFSQYPWSY